MSRQSANPIEATPAPVVPVPEAPEAGSGEVVTGAVIVLLGVALAAWLRRKGVLAAGWLRGRRRLPGLGWPDLLAVVGLWLVGQVVAVQAVRGLFEEAVLERVHESAPALLVLHAGSVLPPTLWVLGRAAATRRGLWRLGVFTRARDLWLAAKALPAAWLLATAVMLVGSAVAWLAGQPTPRVQHDLLSVLQADGRWGTLLPIVLSAVVIAPVAEEVLTRGLFQSLLVRALGGRSRWVAVGLASVGFAALHVGSVPPQALPGLLVLGVVFGALYERTGSLVPGILVHAAFNALNVGLVVAGAAG